MHEQLLGDLMDAYNRHDVEGILALFAPSAVFEAPSGPGPSGAVYAGHESIAQALRARFDASPDVNWAVEEIRATEDGGYASWVVTWTEADGTPVERRGCDLFLVRDGAIVRKDSFFKQVLQ